MVQVVEGPPIVANRIAVNNGHPCLFTHEYPLFTDAHIVAEAAHGPHVFFNTVPMPEPGAVVPSIVLRCSHYLPPVVAPDWTITDAELYHGGSFPEEIAALGHSSASWWRNTSLRNRWRPHGQAGRVGGSSCYGRVSRDDYTTIKLHGSCCAASSSIVS
jgi:hypothetical protein